MIRMISMIKIILLGISDKIELFNHKNLLIMLIAVQTFSSCETDLEVNAPYKEITIVYGLLNQQDSIHFIKINKTFLGKENAYVMATKRDSSEYNRPGTPRMSATVEEWKSGAIQRTWILEDSVITNKDSGNFYYPDQTVYYFVGNLDGSAQYKLQVSINNGEKVVTAKTNVIDSFPISSGIGASCSGIPCISFYGANDYRDTEFKWISVKNGKRYQLKMTINYTDYYTNGSSAKKNIDWIFQPAIQSNNLIGGQQLTVPVKGEAFYKELQRQLEALTDASIKKRTFSDLFFTLSVAGDDLNTYLLANEPSTGIVQEKQEFTNVENGIGIFSSRIDIFSNNKILQDETLKELALGQYTQSLRFCVNIGGLPYGTCPP